MNSRFFRHAYRMVGTEDGAYEALQESYLAIVRSIRQLKKRESFRPWAYGVTTRVCLKARSKRAGRRERYEERVEATDSGPLPESIAATHEQQEALIAQVRELSPRLRSVILLHFYEGLTLKEVAAALELSIGTVKSRLAAALARLRTQHVGVPS